MAITKTYQYQLVVAWHLSLPSKPYSFIDCLPDGIIEMDRPKILTLIIIEIKIMIRYIHNNAIQKMENHTKDHSGTCKPKIVGNFAVQKPSALNIQEK